MEQWCRSVVKYGAYRSVTESGQAIKLFQAPRKIILGLPSIFLPQIFHLWWCETCWVIHWI